MPLLDGLDRSLRWLRQRQKKRQYQVAKAAGITKSMLSAYETGKNDPTLKTLEKILAALDCDLIDLHNAVEIVNGRTATAQRIAQPPRPGQGRPPAGPPLAPPPADRELPPEIDLALAEMLDGCHKLLRQVLAAIVPPPAP